MSYCCCRSLTKIAENGIRFRQIKRWLVRKPECLPDNLSIPSLSMHEFAPLLMLLGFGAVVSFVVLLVERIHWASLSQNFSRARPDLFGADFGPSPMSARSTRLLLGYMRRSGTPNSPHLTIADI